MCAILKGLPLNLYKMNFMLQLLKQRPAPRIEELQTDVDNWLIEYKKYRPHTGRYYYGKTPRQTFK
jgi:hypothetical protein